MIVPDALSSSLQRLAASAAQQDWPASTLYVVATPIGNLADLSVRAVATLTVCDRVACEDTRHTRSLMQAIGLERPLVALHQHNEREASQSVIGWLAAGERVAYVSDAGTPAVSDPGAALVGAVREAGYRVVPLPGPSSATAALSAAGVTAGEGGFHFMGFLPNGANARSQALQAIAIAPHTTVLFEAPHRMAALAREAAQHLPQHRLTVARELTKQFEEVATVCGEGFAAWLSASPHRERGEFVLVVHPLADHATDAPTLPPDAERVLKLLLAELPLKQAVALTAAISGEAKNALYDHALALKNA